MNSLFRFCVILALGASTVLLATGPASGKPPAAERPAIDAASAPPGLAMHMPGQRVVPNAVVDGYFLGPVTPRPAKPVVAGEYLDYGAEIGYVEDLPVGTFSQPNWTTMDDGARVWTVELTSPGSAALRARFHGPWGRDGLELRVYDPVTGNAFGPYTRPRLDENGEWWTTIIFGESIGLEFYQPPNGEARPMPVLPALTGVAKHWSDHGGTDCCPPSCSHLDLLCSPDWVDEGAAVCRYTFIENAASKLCTGALINRSPSDLSPLLLTADHCIDTQATAATVACFWLFQNDACDMTPPPDNPGNGVARTDGAIVLKTNNDSDVSLLGLIEPPGGNRWLGWNSGGWLLQSDAIGIHHPAGSYKRISFGDVTVALFVIYGQNNTHVWRVDWDSGSTEGGSSGSPVLDDSGRIRGQLKGGPGCAVGDYGRFGVSFDTLEPYIFNMASPVYVQAGAGGDQLGTSSEPFDRVYEATFCVFAGDEIRIRPGNYNERFTVWRPMTLKAENGVVRIGTP